MIPPDNERNVLCLIEQEGMNRYWHIDAYIRWDDGKNEWFDEDEECKVVDWVELPRIDGERATWKCWALEVEND